VRSKTFGRTSADPVRATGNEYRFSGHKAMSREEWLNVGKKKFRFLVTVESLDSHSH